MDTFIYGIDFGPSNSAVTIWNATTRGLVRDPRIAIDLRLTRREFNQNSADLTAAITGSLDTFLADSRITPASIETVYLTGGTSLLHKLRQEFITRFGREKIRDGHELTSVADGLALSGQLFFPDLHRLRDSDSFVVGEVNSPRAHRNSTKSQLTNFAPE